MPRGKKKTHPEFIKEVAKKRSDVTVISTYTDSTSFVELECECGWVYEQRAVNLLAGTKGCPICGNKGSGNQTTETFKEKARRLHGDLYDYSKSIYTKAIEKVTITCHEHGDFTQTPHNHLSNKTGCPECGKGQRWSYTEWEKVGRRSKYFTGFKLYKVRCFDQDTAEEFYKVGKTYREVGIRFYDIPYDYEVLDVVEGSARFISELEKTLHKELKPYEYTPIKSFKGASECFTTIKGENDNVDATTDKRTFKKGRSFFW